MPHTHAPARSVIRTLTLVPRAAIALTKGAYKRYRHQPRAIVTDLILTLVACSALFLVVQLGYSWYVPHTAIVHVNDAATKRYSGEDVYLVYTDKGVFRNQDAFLKWNSSDVQNLFHQAARSGQPVKITYYGRRIPWLSEYPNITKATLQ